MASMNALFATACDTRLGRLVIQFGKFGIVGVVGLIVDVAVVSVCIRLLELGPYASRVVSYLCAATVTWALNRAFTFRDCAQGGLIRQWLTFLTANAIGGIVNYSVYASLVSATELFAAWPEAATAAGSLSGLVFNFTASKKFVFKSG